MVQPNKRYYLKKYKIDKTIIIIFVLFIITNNNIYKNVSKNLNLKKYNLIIGLIYLFIQSKSKYSVSLISKSSSWMLTFLPLLARVP